MKYQLLISLLLGSILASAKECNDICGKISCFGDTYAECRSDYKACIAKCEASPKVMGDIYNIPDKFKGRVPARIVNNWPWLNKATCDALKNTGAYSTQYSAKEGVKKCYDWSACILGEGTFAGVKLNCNAFVESYYCCDPEVRWPQWF